MQAGRSRKLVAAVKGKRNGHRDATMIFVGFRHGLRISELVYLKWDAVDFKQAVLHLWEADLESIFLREPAKISGSRLSWPIVKSFACPLAGLSTGPGHHP